jgi:hypothetical protein
MTATSRRSLPRICAYALSASAVIITAASLATAPAGASTNEPSATGSGHFTLAGELRTFTFNAVTHTDGTVTGEAQLDARATGFSEHLQIDCLQVIGNTAYMSGTITRSSREDFVGGTGVFSVQDNGEGNNNNEDQISLLHSLLEPAPGQCELEHRLPDQPIEEGNVQVH